VQKQKAAPLSTQIFPAVLISFQDSTTDKKPWELD
jgi:hypothetical protein